MGDDSVRVRQSNSPDAGSMAKPSAAPETLDSKVARAVAMLQKLG
jgi:hypothetical protein